MKSFNTSQHRSIRASVVFYIKVKLSICKTSFSYLCLQETVTWKSKLQTFLERLTIPSESERTNKRQRPFGKTMCQQLKLMGCWRTRRIILCNLSNECTFCFLSQRKAKENSLQACLLSCFSQSMFL